MRTRLLKYWEETRDSYWFIPSLMTIGAILLAMTTERIDRAVGDDWLNELDWLSANKPAGARAFLSTIAGSMITVAGVTFSITIVAISYATSQFGPRLLTNFMQDKGNQVTLGTFIATFLYCLMVLRTVRSPDEMPQGGEQAVDVFGGFVPHIGVLCGSLFAIASLGVLIFFIHHIPESIHASNVTAGIGRTLIDRIDELFPERMGKGRVQQANEDQNRMPDGFFGDAVPIFSHETGYIQRINEGGLMRLSTEHDLVFCLVQRPGDFSSLEHPLVLAGPAARVDEKVQKAIRGQFAWGAQRTPTQDLMFLVNELVEIAARALSPGINDPFTAMTCLDWLGSALSKVVHRESPSRFRYDEEGKLRVVVDPISVEEFASAIFDQLRPYFVKDRNAALHMLNVIGRVAYDVREQEVRVVLRKHAGAVLAGCETALTQAEDVGAVLQRHRTIIQLLSGRIDEGISPDEWVWLHGAS